MIGPFWLIKGGGNQEKRILLELIDCVVRFCGGRSGAKESCSKVLGLEFILTNTFTRIIESQLLLVCSFVCPF